MGCLQQEIIDCIDTKFHHTVNILDIPYISIVKLLYFHYKKMVMLRTLVWLCMIFMVLPMVEPMRMGLLDV